MSTRAAVMARGEAADAGGLRAAGAVGAAVRLVVVLLLAAGCGESGGDTDAGPTPEDAGARVDAAREDAAPPELPDTGPPDSGDEDAGPPPDAGMPFNATSCLPCGADGRCTGSGQCLTNGATRESFCADPCGDNPSGCVTGFSCLDLDPDPAQTVSFCVPPGASCTTPGTGFGAACFGDASACLLASHLCEGDQHALGYCTAACLDDAECPPRHDCAPGDDGVDICRSRAIPPAELCARGGTAERPCALDLDCDAAAGEACVRSEPTLPGVCAPACAPTGGACARGICLATPRGARCLSDPCACHGSSVPAGTRDLLSDALAAAGLSRCGTTFGVHEQAATPPGIALDPYRLSFFDALHNEPLRAPGWAREVVGRFDGAAATPDPVAARAARMIEHLAELADHPAITQVPGAPDPLEPLASAVARLITETGGAPDEVELRARAGVVPLDLQLALAGVIDALGRAAIARRNAVEASFPQAVGVLYEYGPAFVARRADGLGLSPTQAGNRQLFTEGFGYGHMYGAAVDVLDAIAAADLERFALVPTTTVTTSSTTLLFTAETPIGRIAIGDGEGGLYDPRAPGFEGAWALVVDLGGDDTYRVPVAGNSSRDNSVSVLVDLGGRDTYGYVEVPHPLDGDRLPSDEGGRYFPSGPPSEDYGPISFSETPRQGGARLGTAVHVDLGGDGDTYRSLRLSQGSGVFGAGVLVDDGGDDVYLAEVMAQGAGLFGIGLHLDAGGSDERRAYSFAQGFAYAGAAGLLYDVDGDDRYLMNPGDPATGGDPLYYSAQRPGTANSTLGQGFGFGRRDDEGGGYMSGGIGILIDRTGSDRYQGGVFAQGGGYWFGTGILADEAGADRYDAMWYGMGSGAHYALGLLLEGAGDDVYGEDLPRVNVTIAAGHDYSAAFLIDEAGDDTYFGSAKTVGAGNSNGMGFFADNAGDDAYAANGAYSFGSASFLGADVDFPGSARRAIDTVGVFLDGAGTDTYVFTVAGMPSNLGIGDGRSWLLTANPDPAVQALERGSGVDGEGETTLHAIWP